MYRMSWVKYTNSRKHSYSHMQVTKALAEVGFEVKILPGATMIAYVDLHTAAERKVITDRLNMISRNFPYRFERITETN